MLEEKIVKKLDENKETISSMESCTAGYFATTLTNVDGSSRVLKFSAITYSNEYKIKMGVSEETINKYTVYSFETTHEMVIWLSALDKRSTVYKAIAKRKEVEVKEFAQEAKVDRFLAFKIADEAFAGHGARAVKMCEQIEITDDAYMTMGAIISQAAKRLEAKNSKAARAIQILAKADMDMKSAGVDAWSIVKIALLKIGQLR